MIMTKEEINLEITKFKSNLLKTTDAFFVDCLVDVLNINLIPYAKRDEISFLETTDRIVKADKMLLSFTKKENIVLNFAKSKKGFFTDGGFADGIFIHEPHKDWIKTEITIVDFNSCDYSSKYYFTAFHELAHATNLITERFKKQIGKPMTKAQRENEELVADLTALFLSSYFGIHNSKTALIVLKTLNDSDVNFQIRKIKKNLPEAIKAFNLLLSHSK